MLISVKYLFDVYLYVNLKKCCKLCPFSFWVFYVTICHIQQFNFRKYYMHMGFFLFKNLYIFSNELEYLAELWALYHAYEI